MKPEITGGEEELLMLNEAAPYTRQTEATLRWRRATGLPPRSFRLGRRVMYRRRDLDEWIRNAYESDAA